MRVLSVNVGRPRLIRSGEREVPTAIFKSPVEGRVALRGYNLEGDQQADLTVHGGPNKAVYLYPHEHYSYWQATLGGAVPAPGSFGENLTTEGLLEDHACIGDIYRFGTAVLRITQPRRPCFKLGLKFGRADMVKLFWQSERPGIYFTPVEEGDIGAGDRIERVERGPEEISVADVIRLLTGQERDPAKYARAMRSSIPGTMKQDIEARFA